MPKLSEREFASLAASRPGASEEDILTAAREAERVPTGERSKGWLRSIWDRVNTPTITIPDFEIGADEHPYAKFGKRVGNFAGDVVESLSSPMGLATAAVGGGAAAAGARGLLGISRGARIAEAALQAPYAAEGVSNIVTGAREGNAAQAAAGALEAGLAGYGVRQSARHAFPPQKVAEAYRKSAGITQPEPEFAQQWDEGFAKQVGDAFEQISHAPDDPAVRASYNQLASEIGDQFAFLRDRAGLKMEPWTVPGQPYKNSAEMMEDIRRNNRLFYFPSEAGFGTEAAGAGNPLLQPGRSGLPVNDELRAVHDYFGHTQRGFQFGPLGEENAYREHAAMFTDEAIPALTTETRGQNSWVNAGPHLRRPDGSLPKKGDADFVPPQSRPFAEQKTGLLPDEFVGVGRSAPAGSVADTTLPSRVASEAGALELSPSVQDTTRFRNYEQLLNPEQSPLLDGSPYAVLTAANPDGQVLEAADNAARQQALRQELEREGYEVIEQRGVFGGEPEPSFLVPGMSAEEAKKFGKKWGQQAVISSEGWHRLGDDATFARSGSSLDQTTPDFYSELDVDGQPLRYQLQFPDEAFEPAARSADVAPSTSGASPDVNTRWLPPAQEELFIRQMGMTPDEVARMTPEEADALFQAEWRRQPPQELGVGGVELNTADPAHMEVLKGTLDDAVKRGPRGGSTALSVAAPAGAMVIPDDPESEWDDAARIGLMGAGAAGMAARWFPKGLKEELDGIAQSVKRQALAAGKKPGSFDSSIRTAIRTRIRELEPDLAKANMLEHGYGTIALPVHSGIDFDKKRQIGKLLKKDGRGVALNDWSRKRMAAAYEMGRDSADWGNARWLYNATNGDPEAAVKFTRMLGAFSPQQNTADNTLNAVEAFIRSTAGEDAQTILSSMQHGHPLPNTVRDNLQRAIEGGRIFMDKTEALGSAELGVHDKIPIDQWLLRALGAATDKTPGKGTYRLLAEAVSKEAAQAGESPFSYMARVWVGMQRIAGTPSRSFSESFADIALPGPLTDPGVGREVTENFGKYKSNLFFDENRSSVMPIAQNPSLSYEEWLSQAQSMLRGGYEGGDVLGKKVLPKTSRPTTLERLRLNEARQSR